MDRLHKSIRVIIIAIPPHLRAVEAVGRPCLHAGQQMGDQPVLDQHMRPFARAKRCVRTILPLHELRKRAVRRHKPSFASAVIRPAVPPDPAWLRTARLNLVRAAVKECVQRSNVCVCVAATHIGRPRNRVNI